MTLGLIQFLLGSKHLGQAGLHAAPFSSPAEAATQKRYLWGGLAVLLGVPLLIGSGVIAATVTELADALGVLLMAVIGVAFSVITAFRYLGGRTSEQEIVSAHAMYWYALSAIYCALWFWVFVTK